MGPLSDVENLQFEDFKDDTTLDLIGAFEQRYMAIKDTEDLAQCLDFPTMVKELIACIDRKLKEIDAKKTDDLIDKGGAETMINDLVKEAKGCFASCMFCNRKCELAPHSDDIQHNCDKRGHQMRVFGGGHLQGPAGKYPSLKVCDEIEGDTVI